MKSIIHPSYQMPFHELYEGLKNHVNNGNINTQYLGDLELFNYSRQCTIEGAWDEFTKISRGFIVCPSQQKIVASPFPKFFNYGEKPLESKYQEMSFDVYEKMDGSLAIIYYWDNEWQVATRGSFSSDQAQWAKKWLDAHFEVNPQFKKEFIPGYTYCAEIIYPANRIVVGYDFDGLVLLGGYTQNGEELLDIKIRAGMMGLKAPEIYSFDCIDSILATTPHLPFDEEGYVVRFEDGHRIKIKGEEYCRIHSLISGCNPLAVWRLMLQDVEGTLLEEAKNNLPEEFKTDFNKIYVILQKKFDDNIEKLKEHTAKLSNMTDKEVGLFLQAKNDIPENLKRFIFACKKDNFMVKVHEDGKMRKSFFSTFRPTNNILDGYKPSNAMNRFSSESDT